MTRFIDVAEFELGNNTVERSIRPIKLSRKNTIGIRAWPFFRISVWPVNTPSVKIANHIGFLHTKTFSPRISPYLDTSGSIAVYSSTAKPTDFNLSRRSEPKNLT